MNANNTKKTTIKPLSPFYNISNHPKIFVYKPEQSEDKRKQIRVDFELPKHFLN